MSSLSRADILYSPHFACTVSIMCEGLLKMNIPLMVLVLALEFKS